jgi:hypothetical protein
MMLATNGPNQNDLVLFDPDEFSGETVQTAFLDKLGGDTSMDTKGSALQLLDPASFAGDTVQTEFDQDKRTCPSQINKTTCCDEPRGEGQPCPCAQTRREGHPSGETVQSAFSGTLGGGTTAQGGDTSRMDTNSSALQLLDPASFAGDTVDEEFVLLLPLLLMPTCSRPLLLCPVLV